MIYLNKFIKYKKFYIFFFKILLFINILFIPNLYASSFKIEQVEIFDEFDSNFNKKKVYEKAFKEAFNQLGLMITTSEDQKKLKNIKIANIQRLIDSFNVREEKFMENKYFALFDVSFNRKKTLIFLEKKNILTSVPNKLDVLLIPILFKNKNEDLVMFEENPFYNNWNKFKEKYHLLNYILPIEDIEDRNIINNQIENIENYNFKEFIEKYSLKNFIITIVYIDGNKLKILTRLKLNENKKTINRNFDKFTINEINVDKVIKELKIEYDDKWKESNRINTSINLPLTLILSSDDNYKIKLLENALTEIDLVANYYIQNFNNINIVYKIIYNGSPKKFIKQMKNNGFDVEKTNDAWVIK